MVDLYHLLRDELWGFFSLQGLVDIIRSGDYSSLKTWGGITTALSPLVPIIILVEILAALVQRKFHARDYRIPFFIYVFNRVVGRYLSIGVMGFCIAWLQPIRPFQLPLVWWGFLVGYIVWEFSHFIYHFLAHKVRLFWCLHSTHHAPEQMNLSVSYAHFILEGPYADFIRTSVCIFFGVEPAMLFAIMFIDGTWGGLIHIGEGFIKDSRLGWLGKIILTPSHHRVHHARNPLYMDTNFCNLLNIWDHVFRTYQPELTNMPIEYGITRPIRASNFWDVYFGEFYYLALDVINAPGIRNKFAYLFMPPGWSHTGDHKTASVMRMNYLAQQTKTDRG